MIDGFRENLKKIKLASVDKDTKYDQTLVTN